MFRGQSEFPPKVCGANFSFFAENIQETEISTIQFALPMPRLKPDCLTFCPLGKDSLPGGFFFVPNRYGKNAHKGYATADKRSFAGVKDRL